jgi:hypothetical protein
MSYEEDFEKSVKEMWAILTPWLEEHFGPDCGDYQPGCAYCERWKAAKSLLSLDFGSNTLYASCDTPLRGEDAKWNMATVVNGEYAGKIVVILIKFSDGWCICDMGEDKPLQEILFENLKPWHKVESVNG